MGRMTKPRPQDHLVAVGLANGKSQQEACELAGYTAKTAKANGYKIVKSPGVRAALIQMGYAIKNEDLGSAAKARLMEKLEDKELPTRELVQCIHEGLAVAKLVGPGSSVDVNHRHTLEIPEAARELIAHRIVEITAKRAEEQVRTVDMPALEEGKQCRILENR